MNSHILDLTRKTPTFGEIFISNDETNGGLESLQHFKGKLITSLGGGCGKLFVIEDGVNNEGILSSLHAPEFDEYDYTFNEDKSIPQNIQDVFHAFDGKGSIKKILSGKKHLMFLTGLFFILFSSIEQSLN